MKRRLLLVAVVLSSLAIPAAPAAAAGGAWACAAVDAVDMGVCLYDPIPPPPREHVPEGF